MAYGVHLWMVHARDPEIIAKVRWNYKNYDEISLDNRHHIRIHQTWNNSSETRSSVASAQVPLSETKTHVICVSENLQNQSPTPNEADWSHSAENYDRDVFGKNDSDEDDEEISSIQCLRVPDHSVIDLTINSDDDFEYSRSESLSEGAGVLDGQCCSIPEECANSQGDVRPGEGPVDPVFRQKRRRQEANEASVLRVSKPPRTSESPVTVPSNVHVPLISLLLWEQVRMIRQRESDPAFWEELRDLLPPGADLSSTRSTAALIKEPSPGTLLSFFVRRFPLRLRPKRVVRIQVHRTLTKRKKLPKKGDGSEESCSRR